VVVFIPQLQEPETTYKGSCCNSQSWQGCRSYGHDNLSHFRISSANFKHTAFFFSLDRNLEDVDDFYNKKFADSSRRLKLLQDRYGTAEEAPNGLDRNDIEELMGALLELRGQLRKLQWYGEVNRRGFVKITKKVDKKVPYICTQQRYIASKVDTRPFATNASLARIMDTTNTWLSILGDTKSKDDAESIHSVHSLKHVSSKTMFNLPRDLLDTVGQAIKVDDVPILKETLLEASLDPTDPAWQKQFVSLLQRAISCKSKLTITYLLKEIKSLDESDDINGRNCLHRLVISIGRAKTDKPEDKLALPNGFVDDGHLHYITPAITPPLGPAPSKLKESALLSMEDEHVKLLAFVLDKMEP
jgi:glycerophosphodiester phosphodiesterase